jgi:hypothetical protein
MSPAQLKKYRAKRRAFSRPLTADEIADFDGRLLAVDYGRGQCWLYPGKTTTGASKDYARKWFRGQWTGAHRIALAIKLGCTLWDLQGYDAAHAKKSVCLGGRCCNPAHLFPKESEPNRSWDRARDAAAFGGTVTHRTAEEKRRMVRAMYPDGMPINARFFDAPWDQGASPDLHKFLEMGQRNELKKMRKPRVNTGHEGA